MPDQISTWLVILFLGIGDNWADFYFNVQSWNPIHSQLQNAVRVIFPDTACHWCGRGLNPWLTVWQPVALTITPQTHTLLVNILSVSVLFCVHNTNGRSQVCMCARACVWHNHINVVFECVLHMVVKYIIHSSALG